MAGTTTNLGLYFKDPLTDGNDTFNIQTMLNDNWNKLDAAIGDVKTPASKMGLTGDLSVGAALNVLANIGNVHVWQRVQSGVTDYLTSTDPNAYPKQSAEGGQDASYVLGDVVSGSFGLGRMNASTNMTYKVSDSIDVLDDGTIVMNDSTVVYVGYGGASTLTSVQSSFLGKFVCRINDGDTTHDSYTKLPKDEVVYIPSDAIITSEAVSSSTVFNVDQYQPVTGYPAIPANNVITYLGQLGGGARIEVGSYVGTVTYGSSVPNTLTFGFEPKLVFVFGRMFYNTSNLYASLGVFAPDQLTDQYIKGGYWMYSPGRTHNSNKDCYAKKVEKTLSWYSDDSAIDQLNGYSSNYTATYTYFAFG